MSTTETEPASLTDRQRAVFEYLYEFARDNGYQPSVREIAEHFGMDSQMGPFAHFRALTRKGWIVAAGGNSRSIRFLRRPDGTPFDGFADKPLEG